MWKLRKKAAPVETLWTPDLDDVNGRYATMFELHRAAHETALKDIARNSNAVLDVACGSGFAYPIATELGLSYTGIDISETAIAACCLKFSCGTFVNSATDGMSLFRDQTFDAVYCSSMLEHIGRIEEAINHMWRIARVRLDLVFYEGLTEQETHQFNFNPYDLSQYSLREWGGCFGIKVVTQDHGPRDGRATSDPVPGYFMNRFARKPMIEFLSTLTDSDVGTRNIGQATWVTVSRKSSLPEGR